MTTRPLPPLPPPALRFGGVLHQIAAAYGQPIFDAETWSTLLGDNPAAEAFTAQLCHEWPELPPPTPLCEAMVACVKTFIKSGGGLAWPNLWAHSLRVAGNAYRIAAGAGIAPEEGYLLGILHDSCKLEEERTGVSHELAGALMARKWLQEYNAPRPMIERIAGAISKRTAAHNGHLRLLRDSDKLDKIGAAGIVRRVTTAWGSASPESALKHVAFELDNLPVPNFQFSREMSANKAAFTRAFMAAL